MILARLACWLAFASLLALHTGAEEPLHRPKVRKRRPGRKVNYATVSGYPKPRILPVMDERENDIIPPSLLSFTKLIAPDGTQQNLSVISVHTEMSPTESKWYIPSMHDQYSAGWNRTMDAYYANRPFACHLRFYAVGFEKALQGFQSGGVGELKLAHTLFRNSKRPRKVFTGYGTDKIYCYYNTNKHTGSEFKDKPKTLALAIYCPVTLDMEVGPFIFRNVMHSGHICRPMADDLVEMELMLVESDAIVKPPFRESTMNDYIIGKRTVSSTFVTAPVAHRDLTFKRLTYAAEGMGGPPDLLRGISAKHREPGEKPWEGFHMSRPHAVCAVLTFENPGTGPMLYMWAQYWYRLGWAVIIYDRFGAHQKYMEDMLKWPGMFYHPYTLYQLLMPGKYNMEYKGKQGSRNKYYYKIERNWGYAGEQVDDTADQDGDKTKTYDFARIEYSALTTLLYVDIDELMLCPQGNASLSQQLHFARDIMDTFSAQGIQEMRFVRLPYSGRAPEDATLHWDKAKPDTVADYTDYVQRCMQKGYDERDTLAILKCWSSATAYDNFYKSADMGGVCPFHYNHWSCDGMRGGGRDWGHNIPRCRCKVGFELMNMHAYAPFLGKCHLLHFHHNKYRFQAGRMKHKFDAGNIIEQNPIATFIEKDLGAHGAS